MPGHQRGQPLFAFYRRLQERSGRQRDLGCADRDDRRRSHQHQFAVACQPRQPVLFGNARQYPDHGGRYRAGAAHVDIEAAIGRGDLDVERLSHRDQRLGDGPGRLDRAVQMRIQDRTAVDRYDVVRIGRGKSDLENVMRSHPRVQRDAAAAEAMGIDQRRDLAIDPGLRQRRDHEFALPGAIASASQCWIAQPPQTPKCGQNGVDPRRACGLDRDQSAAVGMVAGNRRDLDRFAAEGVGHVDLARRLTWRRRRRDGRRDR